MIDWSSCTAAMVRPLFSVERRSYRNIGWALVVLCALEFVVQQLERRNLPPRPSRTATYKMMKNTRAAISMEDSV